jgi:hypothetical protein
MKNYLQIGLLALIFSACQEVIEVDLNTTDPQFVVEGTVTDQPGPYRVRITKTVNFDEPNNYPAVSGAAVVITDGALTDTLAEVEPGIYETRFLTQGEPGRTYTLTVRVEGNIFTASSTMPAAVPFDDLTTDESTQPGGETVILMVPEFRDPVGFGNYYRFIQWNNGRRLPAIFVLDDRNSDGLRITRPLFAPNSDIETAVGDTVTVEMQTVDRATYKYFFALDASSGNSPNASVPANPDNNFGGACLGYFSAHTVQQRSLIVQ